MGFPKRGRVTLRWSKAERDWMVAWGPGPGRLKGPAGGLLAAIVGSGPEEVEAFEARLRRSGFDPETLRAHVDCLPRPDTEQPTRPGCHDLCGEDHHVGGCPNKHTGREG